MEEARSSSHPDDKTTPNPNDTENQENTDPTTAGGILESATTTTTTVTATEGNKQPDATGDTGTPAPKKRKLSPASKEAKQQEKEAKERQKQEEKTKKEEEKAKKEEEKRAKEEEKKKRDAEREEERKRKEEKRKAKEEEKAVKEEEKRKKEAAKEEEKRKKEEEKLKKERAQPKLNAFFAKPRSTNNAPANITGSPKKSAGDGNSLDSVQAADNDYQQIFPDFFVQSHTTVAPPHRFGRDSQALGFMRDKVDGYMKVASENSPDPLAFRPSELFQMMPYKRRCGRLPASVRDIQSQMQNRNEESGTSEAVEKPRSFLRQVRMKSLKFGEDVRPPYQGTYTKSLPGSAARKLMRNPFHRGLPETNYDYDSEAEWEEPEEGEELDSEEEEEGSDDGDDDMEGFLDDDDDHPVDGKRRLIVGDLDPVCTGIQWQERGVDPSLQVYKMETISDSVTFPIDPFSTAYWHKPKAADPAPTGAAGRSTLHAFMGHAPANAPTTTQEGAALAATAPVKAKRGLPAEQLEEFKQVVNGSDLSKLGLVEILKKRFPKVSKDALKDTLTSVATRVGQKEADKKWVCK
ncbi:hypothetical protein P170DRAFT_422817 [Aspergillus steynii IBT 23096]|uniref:Chromatin assembly factor 1 subunit A n=1 Tax=Aspergillus steynii IBT 23096 TaxID=1392250 RepID=A0A2I2GG60_9EURO|nr:uncharacterized protein P170DRAFT_422817 [Aspergillus steynii IBT 23096]PLB51873.1 hypothetical protein P170DRAFT_422817 [Aspergillus steynii IBT 23096]